MSSDAAAGGGAIVISLRHEPFDVAGRLRGEPTGLVVTGDGTAYTWRKGERVRLAVSQRELDRLRRDLVSDLQALPSSIPMQTDRGSTTVAVVEPDSGREVEITVYGLNGPDAFRRAVESLMSLVESIRADGVVDDDAPIVVTVERDAARGPQQTIGWPQSTPEPQLGGARFAKVSAAGDAARALREALGPADTPIDIRLSDGTPAVATWRALLPGFGG